MATAKEKVARIVERIPHNSVAYAFLELEASNINEFAALREEALSSPSLTHYAFAANAPAAPKLSVVPDVETVEVAAEASPAADEGDAEQASTVSAPSEEKLSPREIARQRLLAKKEGK